MIDMEYIGEAVSAAVETLMWSFDIPIDASIDGGVVPTVAVRVADFLTSPEVRGIIYLRNLQPEFIGQNLIFSANSHGAGFWDSGLGEDGDRLHELSKNFSTELFLDEEYGNHCWVA